jgi:hypothetical protein
MKQMNSARLNFLSLWAGMRIQPIPKHHLAVLAAPILTEIEYDPAHTSDPALCGPYALLSNARASEVWNWKTGRRVWAMSAGYGCVAFIGGAHLAALLPWNFPGEPPGARMYIVVYALDVCLQLATFQLPRFTAPYAPAHCAISARPSESACAPTQADASVLEYAPEEQDTLLLVHLGFEERVPPLELCVLFRALRRHLARVPSGLACCATARMACKASGEKNMPPVVAWMDWADPRWTRLQTQRNGIPTPESDSDSSSSSDSASEFDVQAGAFNSNTGGFGVCGTRRLLDGVPGRVCVDEYAPGRVALALGALALESAGRTCEFKPSGRSKANTGKNGASTEHASEMYNHEHAWQVVLGEARPLPDEWMLDARENVRTAMPFVRSSRPIPACVADARAQMVTAGLSNEGVTFMVRAICNGQLRLRS